MKTHIDSQTGHVELSFSIFDAIHDSLDDEMRIKLVESLSCADNVFMDVVDVLTDKYTLRGFSVSASILEVSRKAVALHSGKITQEFIDKKDREIESLKEELRIKHDEYLSYVESSAKYSWSSDHYKALYLQLLKEKNEATA